MKIYRHVIGAHTDFEFNSKSKRSVDYNISLPDGPVKGIVVFIVGFGSDASSYRDSFQKHISEDYSMACLTVDYHGMFSRPSNGGQQFVEPATVNLLRSITGCVNGEDINEVILKANELKADKNIPLRIPGIIVPGNDEYQNFGILPALDHLYALHDVFDRYPEIPKLIYAIGSSYGGYIANLMAKLAPGTLNAVFDNSSWAVPNTDYIVGNSLGSAELTSYFAPDISFELNVLSPWSSFAFMPNGFTKSRMLIRSFPQEHLEVMRKEGKLKTIYRFVHAQEDDVADTQEKISLARQMIEMGFNLQMDVYSEEDIDGKYVKNMNHGMDLSLREFFKVCFEHSRGDIAHDGRTDFDFEHSLEFCCDDIVYVVNYSGSAPPECCVLSN